MCFQLLNVKEKSSCGVYMKLSDYGSVNVKYLEHPIYHNLRQHQQIVIIGFPCSTLYAFYRVYI